MLSQSKRLTKNAFVREFWRVNAAFGMLVRLRSVPTFLLAWLCICSTSHAQEHDQTEAKTRADVTETHAIALHGEPIYAEDFKHFDWANPDAKKGGTIRLVGFGTFDSLNPYTFKGISPINTPGMYLYGFSELNETLLIGTGDYSPSADEAQTAYGLLAETIRYPDDFSWVEFDINPAAYFHDKHPVTSEDVVYSYHTLIEKGHPRFKQNLLAVESVEAISERTVRFWFKSGSNKPALFRVGEMPVLPKHYWQDKDFERSSSVPPLLSGPYALKAHQSGAWITYERQKDFWAKDLNVYRGRFNFDDVRIDFYRDQTVAFEAFKSNDFDVYHDYTAKNWASGYTFPAITEGLVVKEEVEHKIPSGTQGFFFNTRRTLFNDSRVRQAISEMFDFEWTNEALFHKAYKRNKSYFPNSEYSATGLPTSEELALLEPYKAHLPKELFTQAFGEEASPKSLRTRMRKALNLLKDAGWNLSGDQLIHSETGQLFEFEFIYRQAGLERVIIPYIKNLERIGIHAKPRLIEAAQYKARLDNFDYDMMTFVLSQGMSPSYEQRDYYHSELVSVLGSQNYAGINSVAVDALIEYVINAKDKTQLATAMRALDRVLLWQFYIVPNWHIDHHRLAYWSKFAKPTLTPKYKLGTENWWID
jgi:microcin C transport system substrate-binding protein